MRALPIVVGDLRPRLVEVAAALIIPRRFQLLSLTAVLCSLSAIGIAFQPHEAQLSVLTSSLLMEFLAGVWLSEIIRRGKIPGVKTAVAMLFIGLFGFVASLRGPTPELWHFIFWGGPSLLVKSLKLLGGGSYSIYLFHPFVLKSVATPLAKFPALICVAAVVMAGAAVGLAAFYMLERPLLTLLRRWTGSVVAAPATVGVSKSRR